MTPILGVIDSSKLKITGIFDSIATSSPTSGTTVTFSSIPSTYQHLQLRLLIVAPSGTNRIQFNGDTSSANYSVQWGPYTTGNNGPFYDQYGPSVYAGFPYQGQSQTGTPQFIIMDIHNYASSSIKKTVQMYYGAGFTGSTGQQFVGYVEGAWLSTNAINSITISSGTYASGTKLALYGIKVS